MTEVGWFSPAGPQECPRCDGTGAWSFEYTNEEDVVKLRIMRCSLCKGSGHAANMGWGMLGRLGVMNSWGDFREREPDPIPVEEPYGSVTQALVGFLLALSMVVGAVVAHILLASA